ncbi:MAG: ABC transporter permease [Hydrogenophaga sp.]|nr:ABC transporter permease [Hydrogenophaga sp.]
MHLARALRAVVGREIGRFLRQPSRLGSALVRPLLWFVVFAAGFHNVFGVAIIPPYETYIEYKVYMVPGLLGMVALFNGMQSSLSMVYDREMGVMRLLLTAPLARGWLLAFKLLAGTCLSVLQMVVFLAIAWVFGVDVPLLYLPGLLVAMACGATLLAALGLMLSVYVKQLENFAGTMNFVIFPMFFISPALYPLWKLEESGAYWLLKLAEFNPFTHAVEAMRFAMVGQFNATAWAVVLVCSVTFFVLALWGYDPQRGWIRQRGS